MQYRNEKLLNIIPEVKLLQESVKKNVKYPTFSFNTVTWLLRVFYRRNGGYKCYKNKVQYVGLFVKSVVCNNVEHVVLWQTGMW